MDQTAPLGTMPTDGGALGVERLSFSAKRHCQCGCRCRGVRDELLAHRRYSCIRAEQICLASLPSFGCRAIQRAALRGVACRARSRNRLCNSAFRSGSLRSGFPEPAARALRVSRFRRLSISSTAARARFGIVCASCLGYTRLGNFAGQSCACPRGHCAPTCHFRDSDWSRNYAVAYHSNPMACRPSVLMEY